MALRLAFKINRHFASNRLISPCFNIKYPTQRNYSNEPNPDSEGTLRTQKSLAKCKQTRGYSSHAPTTTKNVSKIGNKSVPIPMNEAEKDGDFELVENAAKSFKKDHPMKRDPTALDLRNLQPASLPEYYTPTTASNSARFPEQNVPQVKRFERSSTQNALTMPLKLPRLASPFPEPVKVLPSQTVSDSEKAELMQAEVKMEQRYRQQQAHEQAQQEAEMLAQESSRKKSSYSKSPSKGFGKGKREYSTVNSINPNQPTQLEQCERILLTLKSLYPDIPLPKKPIFEPGSEEEKIFVRTTLQCIAKVRQGLKQKDPPPFPSYSEVKSFIRKPTLQEIKTKPFPKDYKLPVSEGGMLQNNERPLLKSSSQQSVSNRGFSTKSLKNTAEPESMYSMNSDRGFSTSSAKNRFYSVNGSKLMHVKDEGLEGKKKSDANLGNREFSTNLSKEQTSTSTVNNVHPRFLLNRRYSTIFLKSNKKVTTKEKKINMENESTKQFSSLQRIISKVSNVSLNTTRDYAKRSSKKKGGESMCNKMKDKTSPCPKFRLNKCKEPEKFTSKVRCNYVPKIPHAKQLAPYPSYSECIDDPYEDEPSECKICPWPTADISYEKVNKKKYSTAASASTSPSQMYTESKEIPEEDEAATDIVQQETEEDLKKIEKPIKQESETVLDRIKGWFGSKKSVKMSKMTSEEIKMDMNAFNAKDLNVNNLIIEEPQMYPEIVSYTKDENIKEKTFKWRMDSDCLKEYCFLNKIEDETEQHCSEKLEPICVDKIFISEKNEPKEILIEYEHNLGNSSDNTSAHNISLTVTNDTFQTNDINGSVTSPSVDEGLESAIVNFASQSKKDKKNPCIEIRTGCTSKPKKSSGLKPKKCRMPKKRPVPKCPPKKNAHMTALNETDSPIMNMVKEPKVIALTSEGLPKKTNEPSKTKIHSLKPEFWKTYNKV